MANASVRTPAGAPRRVAVPSDVQPWLRRIGQLAAGRGLSAYAVGGCVRDWLLGRNRHPDLDVTVEADGIALAGAIARAFGGTVQAHEPFGTATVLIARGGAGRAVQRIDVATARKETYARPGAYPTVAAGTLRDDLFRRDFTINAMAVALHPERFGELIDPFGGAEDLRHRRLRALHARSFFDDPSRALRGLRFRRRFGLRWESETLRALRRAMAEGALGWLNAGRLRKELERMAEEPDPAGCLRDLAGLLSPAVRRPAR